MSDMASTKIADTITALQTAHAAATDSLVTAALNSTRSSALKNAIDTAIVAANRAKADLDAGEAIP